MKNIIIYLSLSAVLLLSCGCGNERELDLPLASTDLMIRFFASLRKGDFASAVQQGVKLYAVDNNQDAVKQLIELAQANQYVTEAQKYLNSGDLKSALAVLEKGKRVYPNNNALPHYYRKVVQLRNASALLDAMERANNSASMAASLTAARVGLAANITPKLEAYFAEYEKKIEQVRKTEHRAEKTPSLVEPHVPVVSEN